MLGCAAGALGDRVQPRTQGDAVRDICAPKGLPLPISALSVLALIRQGSRRPRVKLGNRHASWGLCTTCGWAPLLAEHRSLGSGPGPHLPLAGMEACKRMQPDSKSGGPQVDHGSWDASCRSSQTPPWPLPLPLLDTSSNALPKHDQKVCQAHGLCQDQQQQQPPLLLGGSHPASNPGPSAWMRVAPHPCSSTLGNNEAQAYIWSGGAAYTHTCTGTPHHSGMLDYSSMGENSFLSLDLPSQPKTASSRMLSFATLSAALQQTGEGSQLVTACTQASNKSRPEGTRGNLERYLAESMQVSNANLTMGAMQACSHASEQGFMRSPAAYTLCC